MKNRIITIIILAISLSYLPLYSQSSPSEEADTTLLGLPGDNLDLYAVLDVFQESKTIEEFEKTLNDEKKGINNLDLNLDDKVDFIKVETKQDKNDFIFVLQVYVLEKEIQDVAVITVSKDKEEKVAIQIIGDKNLYGENYVIEPKPAATPNPGYTAPDTVVVVNQPTNTVVVVESAPVVQYIYSPVYVPYYPPYYYGYYPVYYTPYPVISITFYGRNNRRHHHHYHGGRNNRGGNTVVINNNNNYNSYNNTRNTSNTVNRNKNSGSYKKNGSSSTSRAKPSTKPASKPASKPSTRPASKPASKPSTKPASKPAPKPSTRPASKPSAKSSTRPSSRPASKSKGKPRRR